MGPFGVYGAFWGVWGPLGCMGPFRVYVALWGVWGPLDGSYISYVPGFKLITDRSAIRRKIENCLFYTRCDITQYGRSARILLGG